MSGLRRRVGDFWRVFRRSRQGMVGLVILIVFVLVAVFGPPIVGPPDRAGTYPPLLDPSLQHLFGTDRAGRVIFTLVIHGTRISMIVGIVASVITVLIGASVGIVAGFLGGRTDTVLLAGMNFFYVLPTLVLAIVLATLLGPSLLNVIVVIGITSWAGTALIIRSQTLSIRERTFVDRARAYGASNLRLMTRHVFPNVFALILANATLTVAAAIFLETTLSFLGVGDKNTFSWGRILEDAFNAGALTLGKFMWFVPPGLGVVLVVLAFTLVGQAFDEVLNPRLRAREAGTLQEVIEESYLPPPDSTPSTPPGSGPPPQATPSGG
jgi:peptide/nickel transport system permease protein